MTQPTHDEVMAFLDEWKGYWFDWLENAIGQDDVVEVSKAKIVLAQNSANLAGLERHKPKEHCKNPNCTGPVCSECGSKETVQIGFPCPSYTDIAEPIRSVM